MTSIMEASREVRSFSERAQNRQGVYHFSPPYKLPRQFGGAERGARTPLNLPRDSIYKARY
jgi:hypothetical protein